MVSFDWSVVDALIVEDSPTQALFLQDALEEHKINVIVAKNGLEALEVLKTKLPQMIISDVEMPKMNGYELCRKVKEDSRLQNIPFILLTSLSDALDVIRGIECGADSFMTKPYNIEYLLANMQDLLSNRKESNVKKTPKQELEVSFAGTTHKLLVDQAQVTSLLLSTYSNAIQKNRELETAYQKLNASYQEIEKKNEELKVLNDQKNQFVGMAAHDLRNPLMVIQGFSEMLQENLSEESNPTDANMLGRIQKSSSFMLQLINDLLDISSIESGKVTINLMPVDIVMLIKEIVSLEKNLAEKKNIKLEFQTDLKLPPIMCDQDKIDQVLTNLLTNAIKYSYPETTIEVSLKIDQSELIVAVKDQGQGIPENEVAKLFQPFTRTSVKSTAGEASTGLGLAIVKKIVTEHKGRIWAESVVGKGSTFYVALPMSPVDAFGVR
jgi:two-component system sensor histidine kinase/response regulator